MIDTNTNNSVLQRKSETMEANMVNEKDNELSEEKIEWTSAIEIKLLNAMRGLKPVGINRHFMMMCVHRRFSSVMDRDISSKIIWDYLESSFDLAVLHESEILPFPNDEVDYELPSEFYELAKDQLNISLSDVDEDSRDSKSEVNNKASKKSSSVSKAKQNGTSVSNSKNTFVTPVSSKTIKQSLKKSETKLSSSSESKTKQESSTSKLNKIKRSSSPFTSKNSRSDSAKEDTPEPPPAKKMKLDTSTPLTSKKPPKTENSSSKKSNKQELNTQSKTNKTETPANSAKKLKSEKEPGKKDKASTPGDSAVNKKNSKVESKKKDQDSAKKMSDIPTTKSKSDRASSVSSKGSRHEDSDSSVLSGSRKSSPAVKGDLNDKKKKKNSPMKRRRN